MILAVVVMQGIVTPQRTDARELTDGKTVLQMSDGETRFYAMPYDKERYMWQLSFPAPLVEAPEYGENLKGKAMEMCAGFKWVEGMISDTDEGEVSGYPVYDRDVVPDFRTLPIEGGEFVTVIGDAAHPMSPFKGQGANQGLIDALKLARTLSMVEDWKDVGSMNERVGEFEREMQARAGVKVAKSREAARFLHTPVVLEEGDVTRGGMEDMINNSTKNV
jgi:2-polyprenyl-6-methoxyphenol hydroxylase-like FAD-dependent oxidoreductase